MKIRILCCGRSRLGPPRRCTAREFQAYCAGEAERSIVPAQVHPIRAEGRPVYVAPGLAARETAALYLGDTPTIEEPLLAAVPVCVGGTGERRLPRRLWALLLGLWRRFGAGRRAAIAQADRLIEKLEAGGEDCVLVCPVSLTGTLLDRLRRRGGVITRSGVFSLKPLEQILVTRRDMHCGGCRHNCLLANPGCGVGRDKARRRAG